MKDKERLLELLESFGVKASVRTDMRAGDQLDTVTLEGQQGGVGGYRYLCCDFVFNEDGSFRGVGVWE
ncbi:hypothetical protein [Streptomyces roseolus]|uniref:hypothetical protein n=1 Tax=Streptomyces roseolus TaxID=67358 RepID=UPI00364E40A0